MKGESTFSGQRGMDGASVQDYRIFHDGQTESCTSHRSASALVDAVESFEQAGKMFLSHSGTVVGEEQRIFVVGLLFQDNPDPVAS